MITRQREKYAWDFVFLGANQDAIEVGETIGVASVCAVTFDETPGGAAAAFSGISQYIGAARVSVPPHSVIDHGSGVQYGNSRRSRASQIHINE